MLEILDIPGFPGYRVDKMGNIYGSKNQRIRPRKNGRYLQVDLYYRPYPQSKLIQVTKRVHIIVCQVFLGQKPTKKHQVRHLDGNPTNNCISNLCWGTAKENADDKKRHGTHNVPSKNFKKSKYYGQIERIKSLRIEEKMSLREIAKLYRTSASHINRIVNGINWSGC